jgi:fluoroquinolone resistance protein
MNIRKNDIFENIDFKGIRGINEIRSKSFNNCTFTDCDFKESDFSASLFSDCIFKTSNLSLIKLTDTKLQNVHFDECKILGVDFTPISKLIVRLGFRHSQISECSFAALQLKGCAFLECRIRRSDFFKTNLTKSNFSGSDLQDTIFENSNLTAADFKNAHNFAINPLNNQLKNAEFSLPEAVSLLLALGIFPRF